MLWSPVVPARSVPSEGERSRRFRNMRKRTRWILFLSCSALLLLVGVIVSAAVMSLLREPDWTRHEVDSARVKKLAKTDLPPVESVQSGSHDWPQWLGPNRNGFSAETGLMTSWPDAGPRIVWKKPIGPGFSSLAIVGERAF